MNNNYIHTYLKDDLHNEADFFLKIGEKGTGWTKEDRAITLIVVSEDINGKHTFYTSENYKDFLARLNMSYIFEKYGEKQVIDGKKFQEENIKKVLEDRRDLELSKEDANELYTFLKVNCDNLKSEDELFYLIKDNLSCLDELDEYFYIYHKWTERQIAFYEKLWKEFINELK